MTEISREYQRDYVLRNYVSNLRNSTMPAILSSCRAKVIYFISPMSCTFIYLFISVDIPNLSAARLTFEYFVLGIRKEPATSRFLGINSLIKSYTNSHHFDYPIQISKKDNCERGMKYFRPVEL